MSEIAIKIGDSPTYKDGDIVDVFNRRRIRCAHAHHLCFPRGEDRRLSSLKWNGLIGQDDVAVDFMEITHQYRFMRTGPGSLRITRLAGGDEINITDGVPFIGFDGRLQYMHVRLFIAKQRVFLVQPNGRGLPMFGDDGREFWYGGDKDFSAAAMTKVWNAIQAKLGRSEFEFQRWPAGRLDLRSFLFLKVKDVSDAEAHALKSGDAYRRRIYRVDWRDLELGVPVTSILDKTTPVDVRTRRVDVAALRKPLIEKAA